MTEDCDINFVSRDFYRGTTRGFEFSLVDILSISLLLSALLVPRRDQSRGYWPASLGLMILFFCYACINVGMADPKLFGLFELSKMVRGMTIFLAVAFYLRTERELRIFILASGLVVCYGVAWPSSNVIFPAIIAFRAPSMTRTASRFSSVPPLRYSSPPSPRAYPNL